MFVLNHINIYPEVKYMADKVEDRADKVLRFYSTLPMDILRQIINNMASMNREEKRKFSKAKNYKKIIGRILDDYDSREAFSDAAYRTVKDKITLDLKNTTYDEIIHQICTDKYIENTILFFRWCYEDTEDGESNDKLYFEQFVDSEVFDMVLKNEVPTIPSSKQVNNNEAATPDDKSEDLRSKAVSTGLLESKRYNKMKLIGRIEQRYTFYNFFPQFEVIDGEIEEIPNSKLINDYPDKGGINLSYAIRGKTEDFLKNELSVDNDSDLFARNLYAVEIDNYDLEENNNPAYKTKIELENLLHRGIKLKDIIRPASCEKIYKIVTCESNTFSLTDLATRNIFVSETNLVDNEPVLFYWNGKYYGPFIAKLRIEDGKFRIKNDTSDYLLPCFDEESVKRIEFEKQAYYEDPHNTLCGVTIGDAKIFDAISDETLLAKITEDISLSVAEKSPEEFIRLCSDSPFFSSMNQTIAEARLKRIADIIERTDKYQDEKKKIFDMLLKHYQTQSFELSKETIMETDTYKSIESRYDEVRKRNDEMEKKIRELENEKKDLSSNVNANGVKADTISAERVSEYEKKIKEYEDKIGQLSEICRKCDDIEKLKEKQKALETNNEYLINRNNKLKTQVKEAQDQVSDAIKDGITNSAKIAFDPYISNAMLKSAAEWDSNTENDTYKSHLAVITSIEPSALSGTELVDYIVSYVQKRRGYSKNEIINIYTSIVQNFITVFSGEPGTGKTSMCNLIANSLGLNNFGTGVNRFVPVSVERGWSSKRDFIGYFNPLTKKYDKSNSKVYDALKLLDIEGKNSNYPFFILLDEANLSPMEYYWADFMRLTDRSSESDTYLNIGTEQDLYVPETLRFMATINTDQTTEMLSPRLIDRASIIKLPVVKTIPAIQEDQPSDIHISWKSLVDTFSCSSELLPSTDKTLKEIYSLFASQGRMNVSPRVQISIERYVRAAQTRMIDETGVLAREQAIDYAVLQKLMPKINGYYANYQRFFDALKKYCVENHLNMTNNAITVLEASQEKNMGYCQYLI